jgi:hypothetical protein
MRRVLTLEFLQWYGLLGAALVWAAQLVLAFGLTVARCGAGGSFGLSLDSWEVVLMVVAVLLAVLAECAAVAVFLETRSVAHDGPPPGGRRHFFASAAMIGNLLFLMIILLSGIGIVAHSPVCHQS